ncbi:hypothetical protein HDV05_008376 [Chytridiales sp. JEL 0842]|nr:hypothetical protein HDV05_008376 [Chytridiales sp. JEL 0842]
MLFNVDTANRKITISLTFWNKIATLQFSDIVIPFDSIDSVVARPPEAQHLIKGFRVGTELPGVIAAGSFYHLNDKSDFYMIYKGKDCIGIKLKGDAVPLNADTASSTTAAATTTPPLPWKAFYLHVEEPETPEQAQERIMQALASSS